MGSVDGERCEQARPFRAVRCIPGHRRCALLVVDPAYAVLVDLPDLAELVGAERFERACEVAWATAEGTGRSRSDDMWPDGVEDVPHELSDAVEGDLGLAFSLFRAMPCFANLMYVGFWGIGPGFWAELRALLGHPDPRLAEPVLYWLWCGPFEVGGAGTETAWHEVAVGADGPRLRRVLRASGPVSWCVKGPLLEGLAAEPEWHAAVRDAVEAAATDVYGALDMPAALRLLRRLELPDGEIRSPLDRQAGSDGAR
jgi:hypothetical protein